MGANKHWDTLRNLVDRNDPEPCTVVLLAMLAGATLGVFLLGIVEVVEIWIK